MAALDTISISPECMKPAHMSQKEPRQAAVDKEFWKRTYLGPKALAENTLRLATRNPIMLLRVRQKEREHRAAVARRQAIVKSRAKEDQRRVIERKAFDEIMQGAAVWRDSLDTLVASATATSESESESESAGTSSSQPGEKPTDAEGDGGSHGAGH